MRNNDKTTPIPDPSFRGRGGGSAGNLQLAPCPRRHHFQFSIFNFPLLLFLAVSCGRDGESGVDVPGASRVRVAAGIEAGLARGGELTVPEGYALHYIMEVWTTGADARLVYREERKTATPGNVDFELNLDTPGDYQALFWTDFTDADTGVRTGSLPSGDGYVYFPYYASKHYNTLNGLKDVRIWSSGAGYTLNDVTRDAFQACLDIRKEEGAYEGSVVLTRPFGQLNVVETDEGARDALESITVEYGVPWRFDVSSGTPGNELVLVNTTVTDFPDATGDRKANLFYDYIFTPTSPGKTVIDGITITFTPKAGCPVVKTLTLPGIPVARNRRTNANGIIVQELGDRIPDEKFRDFCVQNGFADADGYIIINKAAAEAGLLDLSGMSISSLEGIGYFTGIAGLNCTDNALTSLDVSRCTGLIYLDCSDNSLETLDVSGCTGLTDLSCSNNSLETLNVSGCTGLEYLYCSNNRLATLDVSGCTGLVYLSCSGNSLETLDVSNCTGLTRLYCSNNSLETLNVLGCTGLTDLYCFDNRLATLDASKMNDVSNWYLFCGNQTSDGSAARELTLTLRANQKERWESPLKPDPNNQNVTPIYSEL